MDVLLSFTGIETDLKATHLAEWSDMAIWNPEARYNSIGVMEPTVAIRMVASAKILIELL